MPSELEHIKTMTLREYIDSIMNQLQKEGLELFDYLKEYPLEIYEKKGLDLLEILAKQCLMQDIVYLLEYGFIKEIGNQDLKM